MMPQSALQAGANGMNTVHSRKPLLWAYIALAGYPFLGSIFNLVFAPYSVMRKIGFSIELVALCVSVTFVAIFVVRRPSPWESFHLNAITLFFGVLGLLQAGAGGLALYSLLKDLPLEVDSLWHF